MVSNTTKWTFLLPKTLKEGSKNTKKCHYLYFLEPKKEIYFISYFSIIR